MTFGADEPIDVEILGYDLATGSRLAKEVDQILKEVRGVTDIQVGREEGFPEYQVRVRQDRIASLGLTTSRVAEIVRGAIEGTESSIYVDPQTGREHNVRVRLREEDRRRPEDLNRLPMPALGGKVVPLENVAEIVRVSTPVQLERKYQQRIVHVTANTSGRDLGSIASEIETKVSQMKIPEGFSVLAQRSAPGAERCFPNAHFCSVSCHSFDLHGTCFPIRFFTPSFSDYVLSSSRFHRSRLGALPHRKYAERGLLYRDHYDGWNCGEQCDPHRRLHQPPPEEEGVELKDAITRAGRIRLRPILMTTLTTICGLIPMALGLGEGSRGQCLFGHCCDRRPFGFDLPDAGLYSYLVHDR